MFFVILVTALCRTNATEIPECERVRELFASVSQMHLAVSKTSKVVSVFAAINQFDTKQIFKGATAFIAEAGPKSFERQLVLMAYNHYTFDASQVPIHKLSKFWAPLLPPLEWKPKPTDWPWYSTDGRNLKVYLGTGSFFGAPDALGELAVIMKNCPRRLSNWVPPSLQEANPRMSSSGKLEARQRVLSAS